MEYTKLLSENFESAAYALRNAFDEFLRRNTFSSDVDRLCRATDDFRISVDRLTEALEKHNEKVPNVPSSVYPG
jgi:chemotaxis regulatin CheY-phosphate phosphatase CheZ